MKAPQFIQIILLSFFCLHGSLTLAGEETKKSAIALTVRQMSERQVFAKDLFQVALDDADLSSVHKGVHFHLPYIQEQGGPLRWNKVPAEKGRHIFAFDWDLCLSEQSMFFGGEPKMKDGAAKLLKDLKKDGHFVYIVTNTNLDRLGPVVKLLLQNGVAGVDILYSGGYMNWNYPEGTYNKAVAVREYDAARGDQLKRNRLMGIWNSFRVEGVVPVGFHFFDDNFKNVEQFMTDFKEAKNINGKRVFVTGYIPAALQAHNIEKDENYATFLALYVQNKPFYNFNHHLIYAGWLSDFISP